MDKVILKLLNKDSYVFGGYVRDSIINNEKYNDIDILIMESKENFEKKLKQNFRVYIKDSILILELIISCLNFITLFLKIRQLTSKFGLSINCSSYTASM